MAKQRNALRAGVFILVSIGLIFGIVVGIQGIRGLFDPMVKRKVAFSLRDDLGGLRVGDDVRIGGFRVGEVRSIEVLTDEEAREAGHRNEAMILVTIAMPRKYPLREGAHIGVQTTVTGQSSLNIESLGGGGLLPDDALLAGRPSPLSALLASMPDLGPRISSILKNVDEGTVPTLNAALANVRDNTVPKVNNILDDVRGKTIPAVNDTVASYKATADEGTGLVKDLRGHVKPVVDKYNIVADSTSKMMDVIRDVFGDTKADLRGTIANLNSATANLKEKLPAILEKVDGVIVKVDTAVAEANEALVDVKKTMENTRELTGAAKTVIAGNKGKLEGMIASLKATGDNLKSASSEIRRSPWRLLYKPGPGEMGNLNLFDSARHFADGANDLNDAAQALRDALQDNQANPEEIQRLMDRVQTTFTHFTEVEQKLWKEVRE